MDDYKLYQLCILLVYFFIIENNATVDTLPANEGGQVETVIENIINLNKGSKEHLFEGDIRIEEAPESMHLPTIQSNFLKRDLRRTQEYLWVNRIVPYRLTAQVEEGRGSIMLAMEEISKKSCIRFVEHSNEKHWVEFVNEGACFSTVGRRFWREGAQQISLSKRCQQSVGTVIHELLHALGFWHEQSRPDRDNYVEVLWENILDGEEKNFARYTTNEINSFQSPYDTTSIMHYGRYSFSKNGQPTIVSINNENVHLGQRKSLSTEDIIQLNLLYRCKDKGEIYTEWSEWSPCSSDNLCRIQRQRFCSRYDRAKCPDANMYGIHNEFTKCSMHECYKPREGHWGRWSSWSDCDHPCGSGKRTRQRKCDDPKPKHRGKICPGAKIITETCFVKSCTLGPFDCSFDGQGMCSWLDASKLTYKWQRVQGKTPTGNTGPTADHTTGKTFYMYAEASAPAATGMHAVLESKTFPANTARCVEFFYSMHGVGIGALRVYISDQSKEKLLWEKIGPQGNKWNNGQVQIKSQSSYKVLFVAERGASFIGDIGLDDIFFRDGNCIEEEAKPLYSVNFPLKPITHAPSIDILSALCGIKVKPVGCYAEISVNRAIPHQLVYVKDQQPTRIYDHRLKKDLSSVTNRLFCDCLSLASSGYKYIGMQQGKCYGVNDAPKYNKYGISTECVDEKNGQCYHVNKKQVCVGKLNTNYVYQLI